MEKKDLKVGQVVELRNGTIAMVMPLQGNKLSIASLETYCNMNYYNEDLTYHGAEEEDIVAVYGYSKWANSSYKCSVADRELLWNREPKQIELTLDEIAEKFNIPINQLKIKK